MADQLTKKAQTETFTPQAPTQMERVIHGMSRDIATRMIQINHLLSNSNDDERVILKGRVKDIYEGFTIQCEEICGKFINDNTEEEKSLWIKLRNTVKEHWRTKRKSSTF